MSKILVLGLLAVVAIWVVMAYNGLVTLKHNVSKAWANIDVLLKQRHDELPKLVEVCRQYTQFEQSTLEKVMQARSAVFNASQSRNIEALGSAEAQLRSGIGQINAVAEAYPELKANDNFQHLLSRITDLENTIADRREFYNESVNLNNVRIEHFPDTVIARLFGFGPVHVVRRHLLPALLPMLVTLGAFGLATVVVAVSTLSFVGIGLRPPTPELGSMMTELLPHHAEAPLQVLMPAALLCLTVLGLHLAAGRDAGETGA